MSVTEFPSQAIKMQTQEQWPRGLKMIDRKHIKSEQISRRSSQTDDFHDKLLSLHDPEESNSDPSLASYLLDMGTELMAAQKRQRKTGEEKGVTPKNVAISTQGSASTLACLKVNQEVKEKLPRNRIHSIDVIHKKIPRSEFRRKKSLGYGEDKPRWRRLTEHKESRKRVEMKVLPNISRNLERMNRERREKIEKAYEAKEIAEKLQNEKTMMRNELWTKCLRLTEKEHTLMKVNQNVKIREMREETHRRMASARVIIVGAGLAGMSAAHRLISRGFKNVVIFEAGKRVGGRIRTLDIKVNPTSCLQTMPGASTLRLDVGAPWIDFPGKDNAVYNLAAASGLLEGDNCVVDKVSSSLVLALNRKAIEQPVMESVTPHIHCIEEWAGLLYKEVFIGVAPPVAQFTTPISQTGRNASNKPEVHSKSPGRSPEQERGLKPPQKQKPTRNSVRTEHTGTNEAGKLERLSMSWRSYSREMRRRLDNQFLKSNIEKEKELDEVRWITKTMLSQSSLLVDDPNKSCALGLENRMNGSMDEKLRLREGMSSLFNLLKKHITPKMIKYNTRVKTVDWSEFNLSNLRKGHYSKIKVKIFGGLEFKADHVIMTVPLGYLKQHAREMFVPELPNTKLDAIENLGWTCASTAALVYDEPIEPVDYIWGGTDVGNSKVAQYLTGRFRIKNHPFHANILELTALSRGLEGIPDRELLHEVSRVLIANNVQIHSRTLVSVYRSNWLKNPHFLGTHPYLTTQCDGSEMAALAKPLTQEGRPIVQFAGDVTHGNLRCLSHAAVASGEREADRLAAHYDLLHGYDNVLH